MGELISVLPDGQPSFSPCALCQYYNNKMDAER